MISFYAASINSFNLRCDVAPAVVNLAIIFGGLLLFVSSLLSDFKFLKKGIQKRWKYLLLPTVIFTAIIIAVDLIDNFTKDTNVLLPHSLLFYPAIAFIVEVIFHLFPVAVLVTILHFCKAGKYKGVLLLIGLFFIALIEPVYQVVLSGTSLSLKNIYVFIHIFLINITGLFLFKKYDFFTMYSFRVLYYLLWHIVWGTIRFYVLF